MINLSLSRDNFMALVLLTARTESLPRGFSRFGPVDLVKYPLREISWSWTDEQHRHTDEKLATKEFNNGMAHAITALFKDLERRLWHSTAVALDREPCAQDRFKLIFFIEQDDDIMSSGMFTLLKKPTFGGELVESFVLRGFYKFFVNNTEVTDRYDRPI